MPIPASTDLVPIWIEAFGIKFVFVPNKTLYSINPWISFLFSILYFSNPIAPFSRNLSFTKFGIVLI